MLAKNEQWGSMQLIDVNKRRPGCCLKLELFTSTLAHVGLEYTVCMASSQCYQTHKGLNSCWLVSWETVFLDTDPAAIAQAELLASVPFPMTAQMISLKFKPGQATPPVKILQWLYIINRIKTKTLNMAQDHMYFAPSCLSSQLPFLPCSSHTGFLQIFFP